MGCHAGNVLEEHRATGTSATMVLDSIEARMPFKVKAIHADGGSEFKALFERE